MQMKMKLIHATMQTYNHAFPAIGSAVIEVNPKYFRPTEVDLLIGNPKKAKDKLGWEAKTRFEKLVKIMIGKDLRKVLKLI